MKKTKTFVLKSETNDNELCKQIFFIAGKDGMEDALIIHKRVLTKQYETYYKSYGYRSLKSFKGKVLCEQVFSIKNTSLNKAIKFFNSLPVVSS